MRTNLRLFILCSSFRVLLALTTFSFFQPDEYFQSLEVAHRIVFGYGHLTWEWVVDRPIRSVVFPALWVPVYCVLKISRLDDTALLVLAPKILQGVFAAVTDVWGCKLTRSVLGERYVNAFLLLSLTSFFHGLSLTRTLSNSLETSLTTAALSFWPWDSSLPIDNATVRVSLVFAAMACAFRPTNAVLWVYLFTRLCWGLRLKGDRLRRVLVDAILIGTVTFLLVFVLDSIYYGKPTLTHLNFLRTNLSAVSLFFGHNTWHFYVTQALPLLCTTSLPFVANGAYVVLRRPPSPAKEVLYLVFWSIGVYSLAGHKEWRFIHPLLPLMHIMAAKSLVDRYAIERSRSQDANGEAVDFQGIVTVRWRDICFLSLSVPFIVYVNMFHSSAQIGVIHYLRTLPPHELRSVGFLMPCHSTPWQAYLHRPELAVEGNLWALGCEPPLENQDLTAYHDQSDIFYLSPAHYIQAHFPSIVDPSFPPSPHPISPPGAKVKIPPSHDWRHSWPSHLVMFGVLLRKELGVGDILEGMGYEEVWYHSNSWEEDERRRGGVVVWRHALSSQDLRRADID